VTKPLVVVESPTKVRTLKSYLGGAYAVAATQGHLMDLPEKEIGIDIEEGFKPKYQNIAGKQKIIAGLKKAAADTMDVYLAPDPDREGEAIAWHASEILKKRGRKFHRVLFHELTKNAILEAMASPEQLNRQKYDAQQARRILDRLVGYQVSPLLWKKVKSGLSAGRVQSVAVRIICDRERQIQSFEPEEYWSITAHLEGVQPPLFPAKLVRKKGKKIKISDQQAAAAILDELAGCRFVVETVEKKTVKKNPLPPFITSKLQQEAIRKLKFSARKTMNVAQQLYEGIELGSGEPVGLITYMRTDSTRVSNEAAEQALTFIRERFGGDYALDKPRVFRNSKKVQDAHEAIRPTSVYNLPDKLAPYLSEDQMALYRLIWQRFVASQMKEALINQNTVSIQAGVYLFHASGSSIQFPGFMTVYLSADDEIENEKKKQLLPEVKKGEALRLDRLEPKQHFTAPPPRFSEASLVKELEENGIGRPSTYATILSTIREKKYVDLIKGYFAPTELGFIVNDLLIGSFPDIFDVAFTAKMEDDLDRVEAAEADSLAVLSRFYEPFKKELETATERMQSLKAVGVPTALDCPLCGSKLHIKMGKNGHFLACSGYPRCSYTSNYVRDEKGRIQPMQPVESVISDQSCDRCGRPMVKKQGKFGTFLACSGYPECRNTLSLNHADPEQVTGVACPEPNCDGMLVKKTSKRGKVFYGCSRYPACRFAIWEKPVPEPCPRCGAPFLVEKISKKKEPCLACITPGCGFQRS